MNNVTIRESAKGGGLLFFCLALLVSTGATSAIITVPVMQPNVNAAVIAAASGDEIQVAAGTWTEAVEIAMATPNVTLTGIGNVSIVPPPTAPHGILLQNGAYNIVMNNIRIDRSTTAAGWERCVGQDGYTSATYNNCRFNGHTSTGCTIGLVLWYGADATVRNCTFSNFNAVHSWSAAIWMDMKLPTTPHSNLIVEDTLFDTGCNGWIKTNYFQVGNQAKVGSVEVRRCTFKTPQQGIPIWFDAAAPNQNEYDPTKSILFEDCLFEGAPTLEVAGFYYCATPPLSFTMRRCEFQAYDSLRRLMWYDMPSPATFENCLFAGGKHESVIGFWGGASPSSFLHCTIVNDGILSTEGASGIDSSMLIDGYEWGRTFTIRNSLLYSPTSYSPALVCDGASAGTRTYDIDYSIIDHAIPTGQFVQLNAGGNYRTASLLFVNEGLRDYHLASGCPGIDEGIDLGIALDLDGNARNQVGGPDMGCFESTFSEVDSWMSY